MENLNQQPTNPMPEGQSSEPAPRVPEHVVRTVGDAATAAAVTAALQRTFN